MFHECALAMHKLTEALRGFETQAPAAASTPKSLAVAAFEQVP